MKCVDFFSDEIHIGPTVGQGDFGKEAAVDQIYLAGPPVPLTRRWDFAERWKKGFRCRRPTCLKKQILTMNFNYGIWHHV